MNRYEKAAAFGSMMGKLAGNPLGSLDTNIQKGSGDVSTNPAGGGLGGFFPGIPNLNLMGGGIIGGKAQAPEPSKNSFAANLGNLALQSKPGQKALGFTAGAYNKMPFEARERFQGNMASSTAPDAYDSDPEVGARFDPAGKNQVNMVQGVKYNSPIDQLVGKMSRGTEMPSKTYPKGTPGFNSVGIDDDRLIRNSDFPADSEDGRGQAAQFEAANAAGRVKPAAE